MARNSPEARSAAGSKTVGPMSGLIATLSPVRRRPEIMRSTTVKHK
jgi:hypothetical protein